MFPEKDRQRFWLIIQPHVTMISVKCLVQIRYIHYLKGCLRLVILDYPEDIPMISQFFLVKSHEMLGLSHFNHHLTIRNPKSHGNPWKSPDFSVFFPMFFYVSLGEIWKSSNFWRILRRNYSSWWSRSSLRSPVWMFFEA